MTTLAGMLVATSLLAGCGEPQRTSLSGAEMLTWAQEAPTSSCKDLRERRSDIMRLMKGSMLVNGKTVTAGSVQGGQLIALTLASHKALTRAYMQRCATPKEIADHQRICAMMPSIC
jgi:hypothetical protein